MDNNTFGTKLKEQRIKMELKQSDVATALGCAPTSLTNYENGVVKPPFNVLSKLCEILEVSPLELLEKKYNFNEILKALKKPVNARSYEEQVAINFSYSILEQQTPAALNRLEKERENQEYISYRTGLSPAALDVNNENKISPQGLAMLNKLLSCEQGLKALSSVDICCQATDSSTMMDDVQILGFMIFASIAIYKIKEFERRNQNANTICNRRTCLISDLSRKKIQVLSRTDADDISRSVP